MKLNHSKLKSFFIGTLLGDSYIYNGSFCCKQISKDLIDFKAELIKKYLPGIRVHIKEYEAFTDKNGVHHQKYWQLTTSRHRYINKLAKVFYPNGKKIYPTNAVKKLDALGFAMWFADDGTTILVQGGKSRRVQLCTDNFTLVENQQIKKELEELGYTIKIVDRARKGQVRIQFNGGKDIQKFIIMMSNYFYNYFPSLLYKMDLGYRGKQLKKSCYVTNDYVSLYTKISAHPSFIDRLKK